MRLNNDRKELVVKKLVHFFGLAITYILVTSGALLVILPFLWMLSTSLKPPQDVLSVIPHLLPEQYTLANYIQVFQRANFGRFMLNSLLVSSIATLGVLLTSTLGGYVFAKYKFRGKEMGFWILAVTMFIPPQIFAFPLYLIMRHVHLIDTYMGIIAPSLIMGFGLVLMRQTIAAIPDSLLDAAHIDGCSESRVYWNVVLPAVKNAIGALGIYAFIASWGYLLWPLIITNSTSHFTLTLGLALFQKRFTVEYGPLMAACTVTTLPLIVVYGIFRRKIVESFVLSGIKG